MLSWTISLLISLGVLLSSEQWNTLTPQEKLEMQSIIIDQDMLVSSFPPDHHILPEQQS
jgi:hypothetical protein